MTTLTENLLIPEKLILKRDQTDFLGTVLTLIKVVNDSCPTAYYAKMKGTCSLIEYVSLNSLEKIKKGSHHQFFINIDDLHKRVETELLRDLECIKRYRKTGKYFESQI